MYFLSFKVKFYDGTRLLIHMLVILLVQQERFILNVGFRSKIGDRIILRICDQFSDEYAHWRYNFQFIFINYKSKTLVFS